MPAACIEELSSYCFKNTFQVIDNSAAVRFLHSVGHSVSKQTVLESELKICKELDFTLNAPNPLTYVETLLEVLGKMPPLSFTWDTRGVTTSLLNDSVE